MQAGRDKDVQQVKAGASSLGTAASATRLHLIFGWVRSVPSAMAWVSSILHKCIVGFLVGLPSFFTALRRFSVDLVAVVLTGGVLALFVLFVTDETIIIETPSVPKSLQERGVTPELLSHMIQVRIQEIRASASSREIHLRQGTARALPAEVTPELISSQVNQIHKRFGLDPPLQAMSGPLDKATSEAEKILAGLGEKEPTAADAAASMNVNEAAAADEQNDAIKKATVRSVKEVIGPYIRSERVTKTTERTDPEQTPVVLATAGFQLSLNKLAQWARGGLGIETQRRLAVSIVCKAADCGDGALSFHVFASAERSVVASADMRIDDLDLMVDAAAAHLFQAFEPQVLARHRFQEGRLEEARNLAEQEISQRSGQEAWAPHLLGLIAMQEEDWGAAKMFLEAANRIDPEFVPARVNLGVMYFREGKFKEAVNQYKEAIKLDPEHIVAYTNLGNAHFHRCSWEEAVAAYEQALAVDPESLPAQDVLSMVKGLPALKLFFSPDLKPEKGAVNLEDLIEPASFCEKLGWKP
ncbi:MAG: hypothetical protein Tsb0032_09930 [Kiloniellaceae bacterium]